MSFIKDKDNFELKAYPNLKTTIKDFGFLHLKKMATIRKHTAKDLSQKSRNGSEVSPLRCIYLDV